MSDWPEEPVEPPPPYSLDPTPPINNPRLRGRYRTDPRLTPRHRVQPSSSSLSSSSRPARGIPLTVLTILSRYLAKTSRRGTLAELALTCLRIYQVVIPHLYDTVTITRDTLPKILYGVDLPFPPHSRKYRPDGTLPPKVIPGGMLKRRHECFGHVRTVRVEGFIPDIWYSDSLINVQPWDTTIFPHAKNLYISAEIIIACIHWEVTDKDHPHPFAKALRRIVSPTHVEITEGVMALASWSRRLQYHGSVRVDRMGRDIIERIMQGWKLDKVVFHGITSERLIYMRGARHIFHFVNPTDEQGSETIPSRRRELRLLVDKVMKEKDERATVVFIGSGMILSRKQLISESLAEHARKLRLEEREKAMVQENANANAKGKGKEKEGHGEKENEESRDREKDDKPTPRSSDASSSRIGSDVDGCPALDGQTSPSASHSRPTDKDGESQTGHPGAEEESPGCESSTPRKRDKGKGRASDPPTIITTTTTTATTTMVDDDIVPKGNTKGKDREYTWQEHMRQRVLEGEEDGQSHKVDKGLRDRIGWYTSTQVKNARLVSTDRGLGSNCKCYRTPLGPHVNAGQKHFWQIKEEAMKRYAMDVQAGGDGDGDGANVAEGVSRYVWKPGRSSWG